jgi:hypothetical protein
MEAFAKSDPESFREYLKKQFLSNNISSKQISLLGRLVFQEGNSSVSDIARVASSGRCPGNAHRDLMRRFCRNSYMPSLFFAEIPTMGKAGERLVVEWPFILPPELAHQLTVEEGLEAVSKFDKGLEPLQQSLHKRADDLGLLAESTLGLGLHGDGVPVNRNMSMQSGGIQHCRTACWSKIPVVHDPKTPTVPLWAQGDV